MSVDQTHVERETLAVEVNIPGHAPRTETSMFERTRKALIAPDGYQLSDVEIVHHQF